MRYALLVYTKPGYGDSLPEAEHEALLTDYAAVREDKRCVASARLHDADMATCVRVSGGRTLLTDGPFADTKEVLGGFALIDASDLDEVLEIAARLPAARYGGAVEVRPVVPR